MIDERTPLTTVLARRAHPHCICTHDDELIKAVAVVGEHMVEPREPVGQERRLQPQVYDARVRLALSKDEFAEVTIICDEDALFTLSHIQHLIIAERRGVVGANPGGVVAEAPEVDHEAGIRTGINQKPHPSVAGVVAGARRCCAMAARA